MQLMLLLLRRYHCCWTRTGIHKLLPIARLLLLSLLTSTTTGKTGSTAYVFPSTPRKNRRSNDECRRPRTAAFSSQNNLWDELTGTFNNNNKGLNAVESPLPYGKALLALPSSSSSITTRTLAIQERGWSFTGEDFDVFALDNGNGAESSNVGVCKIRGALLHLPGKDKMRLLDNDGKTVLAVLDRKLVALSTTYDVYRGGEGDTAAVNQIGWIQKKIGFAFRECFEVYCYSQQSPEAPKSKETLCYKLQGDFLEREFFMTDQSANNNIVAVVSKKGWFRLPSFLDKDATDFYPVQVAPGMDVGLVIACVAVVDEELDEEHQKKKKEREKQNSKSEEGKNGWFG